MARSFIEERTYHPEGMDPDDYEAHSFKVGVYYRGKGKWCVAREREGHHQLSVTGKWLWLPLKMVAMRWCRFDFETACRLAEEHVDGVTVGGRTWKQWQAARAPSSSPAPPPPGP